MSGQPRRLYRSTSNKVIAGVCGGVTEYLGADPTVVRVAWILLSILPFVPGIVLYLAAWFIIPKNPSSSRVDPTVSSGGSMPTPPGSSSVSTSALFGFLFIALGTFILLANLDLLDWEEWWQVSWEYVVPILLIAAGVFLVTRPKKMQEAGEPVPEAEPGQRKALRRSATDRKVAGVCGGLSAYLGVDSSILRIAFVFFTLWPFGLGAVLYLILLLVMPGDEPKVQPQASPAP